MFNHESPLRGETFVTRKITLGLSNFLKGDKQPVALGNLDAKRDWGHAKDYVVAMWMMLQQEEPDDYVIATGKTWTVREFVERACHACDIKIKWQGVGVDEVGVTAAGEVVVKIDPKFYRPTEVDLLLGDPTKAKQKLGWQPTVSFDDLVKEMMAEDMANFNERRTMLLG